MTSACESGRPAASRVRSPKVSRPSSRGCIRDRTATRTPWRTGVPWNGLFATGAVFPAPVRQEPTAPLHCGRPVGGGGAEYSVTFT